MARPMKSVAIRTGHMSKKILDTNILLDSTMNVEFTM